MIKDGIININKPEGWTSQDVCAKLRGILHIKKIGHTGTLDPMATGVLPVCTGKATRIIEYYDRDIKSYRAEMKLGTVTDTLDIWGEVTESLPVNVSEDEIRAAFSSYRGRIPQIPPRYSALKINGKRAYDLAREGVDFEIKSREIMIYSNEIESMDLAQGRVVFNVSCSKGTYIRTICDDIGRTLGCGAVMSALTRTGTGFFRIEDSFTIDEIKALVSDQARSGIREPWDFMIPMDKTLINLGTIVINDNRIIAFKNGNPSGSFSFRIKKESGFGSIYRVYGGGAFLGIGRIDEGSLTPVKVII